MTDVQLLALIGETLDVEDDICGAVCSRRKNGDKIAVWTKTKNSEDLIMAIGCVDASLCSNVVRCSCRVREARSQGEVLRCKVHVL